MSLKDCHNLYRFPELDCSDGHHQNREPEPADDKDKQAQLLKAAESEGYEHGYAEGRDKTLASERNRFRPLRELLVELKKHLKEHQQNMGSAINQQSLELALAMAADLVRGEIEKKPQIVSQSLDKALQMVRSQDKLRIKANPKDIEVIRNVLPDYISDAEAAAGITIAADHAIERGGCLIETEFGVVDARIEQQLDTIASVLRKQVEGRRKSRPDKADATAGFEPLIREASQIETVKTYGHVTKVVGLVVEANGPAVQLGCVCDIHGGDRGKPVAAEVLGFRDQTVLMMPLEEIRSIGPGSRVVSRQEKSSIMVGDQLLGRIMDGLGNPIDAKGPLKGDSQYPIYANPINPLMRKRIQSVLDMGVRSINGLLTVGCGQRMGIFAGSGVGKSVLMGMIARKSQADVNVIALIGERGRELNDFIEKELGEEGLKKSVVVVATSDHLPLVRVRGAFVATAIAEYFRDQGMHVNLMMDSLTRFAMAQREIGLALGEPPTTKGYTPSVFTLLPRLLERAGTSDHDGTITGLYTVLVEGDDMNEPIADAARSILDGHIVLSRDLADQNHYPAIDVLRSVSRVMEDIASLQHKHNAGRLKEMLATYRKAEDLINIGAYVAGSNPAIDRAIEKIHKINGFLRQEIQENVNLDTSLLALDEVINKHENDKLEIRSE